ATVVEIPNRSLNAIVQPEISESIKNNDIQRAETLCKSVSLHLMLSSALIFFFIWINLDALFLLLPNGEMYEAGKSVVLILGFAKFFNSTLFVGSSALNYSKYYYWSLVFTIMLTVTAVLLNVLLIPRFGMDGAAMSHLLSYLTFYLCLLLIVRIKMDINILSMAQLKVLALILGLLVLNFGWVKGIAPLFMKLPFSVKANAIVDAVVKSTVLMVASVGICYFWNISDEVNRLVRKMLRIKG
ncbi:MAG: polysaccharide biosynthesis C-terminal domain-containing protein, partial [Bacteroidales bacterium]|nr:polysaccharide biosynthesis C-terminal domain-containing protein [Bacteroidales bacterium]